MPSLAPLLVVAAAFAPSLARQGDPVALDWKPLAVDAPVREVTLHFDGAAIRRIANLELDVGAWELRFDGLPDGIDEESLVATVSPPARLLDVRFEERVRAEGEQAGGGTPEYAAVNAELEEVRLAELALEVSRRSTEGQLALIDAIASRVAGGAALGLGGELDPTRLRAQLAVVREERDALLGSLARVREQGRTLGERRTLLERRRTALGNQDWLERTGVVAIAMPERARTEVSLLYRHDDGSWEPTYSVRGDAALKGLSIEYDAFLRQSTGEDWNDVLLTLSTSAPSASASPPTLDPVYVDRVRLQLAKVAAAETPPPPPPPSESGGGGGGGGFGGGGIFGDPGDDPRRQALERAASGADIGGSPIAATFVLPRRVTVPSDETRDQRVRVATLEVTPEFVHVAQPLVDPQVYLRAKATNTAAYHLLPGPGRVYLGNESLGMLELDHVPPGGEFVLWFGPDKRLSAKRTLLSKSTGTSGLFSKGTDTTRQYRIDLTSTVDAPVEVEVWDRIPVSRDKDLTVTLSDVSPPLSREATYEADERKQGLLKWRLSLPARGSGPPQSVPIRWTLRTSHPADLSITPIPD